MRIDQAAGVESRARTCVGLGHMQALQFRLQARVSIETLSDIGYATTTPPDLAAAAPRVAALAGNITSALRIDCLEARGAGFRNDVSRHRPLCLFWLLALDLA